MVLVLPTTGEEENLECGRKKSTSPLFLRGADEERLFISGFRNFLSHTIHRIRIWRCCQVPGSDFTCILTCRTEPTRPTNQSLEKKLIAEGPVAMRGETSLLRRSGDGPWEIACRPKRRRSFIFPHVKDSPFFFLSLLL